MNLTTPIKHFFNQSNKTNETIRRLNAENKTIPKCVSLQQDDIWDAKSCNTGT